MRTSTLVILAIGCGTDPGGDKTTTSDSSPVTSVTGPTTGSPTGLPTGTTPTGCPEPPAAPDRGGDAQADALSADPWFREIEVDGLSDNTPTSGAAWVDLDRDGDVDALLSRDDTVEFFRNDGCFDFTAVPLDLDGVGGMRLSGAMAADLDRDGWLDLYFGSGDDLSHSWLLVSNGSWDTFTDRSVAMGVDNPGTYSRGGATVGDINGDGWYDLVIGGHQIGSGILLGRPFSRLYEFTPGATGFDDGSFADLGGTARAPGFGGIGPTCVPGDEATGLETQLVDIDEDGDLDLVWATHNDMYHSVASEPCATGTNLYGQRLWLNDGSGTFTEQAEGPGSFADLGRQNWNATFEYYVLGNEGPAPGAETVTFFDADNDGDRDVLMLAPTDPDWHVSSELSVVGTPGTVATYLRNDGGSFTDAKAAAGLDVLDNTLDDWAAFFGYTQLATSPVMTTVCNLGSQIPLCTGLTSADRQPYPSNAVALDADNDGFTDLLFVVRQGQYDAQPDDDDIRSVLLHNQGDGTFVPLTTEVSGVVGVGLAGFAADLDGDGWQDLHLIYRDELQGIVEHRDRVLQNRGATLFPDHHWVQIELDGRPEPELLGARILAKDASGTILASGWVERDRWRGSGDPIVHLGLGTAASATLEVRLRDGTTYETPATLDQRQTLSIP